MKKVALFLSIVLLLVSCKDDGCEKSIDSIFAAKSIYETAPTDENCLTYKAELLAFIESSCEHPDYQVDYDVIFQSYYDALPCEALDTVTPPPPVVPTCTDGIMNGDETDVDCGGASCLPCADIYIRYTLDGVNYDHTPTQYSMYAGVAPESNHVVTSGNILNPTTPEARLTFKFFNQGQITVTEFQGILNTPIPFETPGQTFAELKYLNATGTSHDTEGAGNDASNSSLTVMSVTAITGTTDSYNVSGTFSGKILDENSNVLDITDGEFSMVYRNLQ